MALGLMISTAKQVSQQAYASTARKVRPQNLGYSVMAFIETHSVPVSATKALPLAYPEEILQECMRYGISGVDAMLALSPDQAY